MSNRYLRRGTAEWRFNVCPQQGDVLEDADTRAQWWAGELTALLTALGKHARPERVFVTTTAQGDDALDLILGTQADVRTLIDYMATCRDFCALSLDAAPLAVGPDGAEIALDDTLNFAVMVEEDDAHQPVLSRAYPFELTVTLNTDLYVEATYRDPSDNRALARANRERLRSLLRDLERVEGVAWSGCESMPYRGQITRDGFVDLRAYQASPPADDPSRGFVIERKADGRAMVRVRRFELVSDVLEVDYELKRAIDAPMARGLILETSIEGPLGEHYRGRFTRVVYRDLQSNTQLEVRWPR